MKVIKISKTQNAVFLSQREETLKPAPSLLKEKSKRTYYLYRIGEAVYVSQRKMIMPLICTVRGSSTEEVRRMVGRIVGIDYVER